MNPLGGGTDDDRPGEADAAASRERPRRRRPEPSPEQRALGLLVRREHSRRELERKLTARGVEPDAARSAVARMTEAGWQDDHRFAASLARSRAIGGYGPLRIRVELETHGLDAAAVEAAFAALADDGEDDWVACARDLVARRFRAPDDEADDAAWRRQRKAAEFLLRRGFSVDVARRASGFDGED